MSRKNKVSTDNKMIVIAEAKGNQISSDYNEVTHGLFTYYIFKAQPGVG